MTATNSTQGMTASISARNRSRRVTFFFAVQASPANVRCSLMIRCSRVNVTHRSGSQYRTFHPPWQETILQSFPRGWGSRMQWRGGTYGRSARGAAMDSALKTQAEGARCRADAFPQHLIVSIAEGI